MTAEAENVAPSTRLRFNPWWMATALAMFWLFYYFMEWLDVNWITNILLIHGPGPVMIGFHRTAVTVLCIGLAGTALGWFYPRDERLLDRSHSVRRWLMVVPPAILFASFYPMDLKANYIIRNEWVEDVGKITIRSDHALMHGINPYAIDVQEVWQQSVKTRGYNYFPVTLLIYLPSALIFPNDPDQAILISNLVFAFITMALMFAIGWRCITPDAGPACALLFLLSALVRMEFIRSGTNDMVPMMFALAALLFIRRRFTCGVLIGLAISSKILPGVLWIPLCLTPLAKPRYAVGLAAGMLPIVPFFLWNPSAFIANTITAIAHRPSEPNSLFYLHPAWHSTLAQCVVLSGFALLGLHLLRNDMSVLHRSAYAAGLVALFETASPVVHQNYFIWWYAPLCVALTGIMFWKPLYRWISPKAELPASAVAGVA